jgi:UDPglucose 6-dehydrogenase/GDP-mannose 6-dehydrogenase
MRITIVGTGYVGLVSGTCFAEIGHDVTCVDVDVDKVKRINAAESPIYEDGLDAMLERNVAAGRLRATTDLRSAVLASELTMIAVGTPFDGSAIDLTYIEQAARQIGEALRGHDAYHVVCVKSTVVPGTTERRVGPIVAEASGKAIGREIGLAMNPEFLAEGVAVRDFMEPDRIVLGVSDDRALAVLEALYAPFAGVDVVVTTPTTAETIKYTANSLLATLISFSNEIANVCSALGDVDVVDVMRGVHLDKRLSPITEHGRVRPGVLSFVFPGTGFGGSCFPKDVKALIAHGESLGVPMRVLRATIDTNATRPEATLDLARSELGSLAGRRVTVLGLAFKPGTDDVRESPAIAILDSLVREGATVTAHDPIAIDTMRATMGALPVTYEADLTTALDGAEVVVLVTSWPQYAAVPDLLAGRPDQPLVVDGRRQLAPGSLSRYVGVGFRPR